MSRIGKKPVEIVSGVEVKVESNIVSVKGPKGNLEFVFRPEVIVKVEENMVKVEKKTNSKLGASLWGTTSRIIENMVKGVSEGFEKKLELNGVGYRMEVQGKKMKLALGFSHPVEVEIPEGISAVVEKNTLTISGIDKQKVGQFATDIRFLKPVEPYKGKGFKYTNEIVRRKEGKKASSN
ncbi:MAG: large subunit ribosomal protein L6 [Parcubacteria group bacterium Athens0714_25]|nr:MAG: large subunit ribosomal protein L6 [Parcubacteria group bacterium Athens0714_25]